MTNNLVDYLKRCDDAYYNTSNPIVSDSTYDALVETLRRLDPKNPYLEKVGAKVRSSKVGRVIPMGTLAKYHKDEEIQKWLESERDETTFLLSPKYDGFAVELLYDAGRLVAASTRGDGNVGEDVLPSMMKVRNVPLYIEARADITIVRGEAIIPTKNHALAKSLGYSAMRNAVPGIVRSTRSDALNLVDFVAYEFIDGSTSRVEQRDYYKDMFTVEDYHIYNSPKVEELQGRREKLRATPYIYELDGVVLKTNTIKEDDLLHPAHMIAWKYKSNRETTCLRDVEYQMGLTGYFTPIGIFDEVEFQGAKLTRASLGNITRMKKEFEGMTIGSLIEVSRRGDIIPYIEELAFIEDGGKLVEYPTRCPHCGEYLAIDVDTDGINDKYEPHCVNKSCPERLRLQISQYAKSIGIKGIGDKLISALINAGCIKNITDIYNVTSADILGLPRQGQSAWEKWEALQDKKLSSAELLSAYPFLNLGRKVWDVVLTKFSYSEIMNITEDDLREANLKGIGTSKIKDIVSQVSENRAELLWLGQKHGILI